MFVAAAVRPYAELLRPLVVTTRADLGAEDGELALLGGAEHAVSAQVKPQVGEDDWVGRYHHAGGHRHHVPVLANRPQTALCTVYTPTNRRQASQSTRHFLHTAAFTRLLEVHFQFYTINTIPRISSTCA